MDLVGPGNEYIVQEYKIIHFTSVMKKTAISFVCEGAVQN